MSLFEINYLDDLRNKVSSTYETHWNIDLSITEKDKITLYDCLDYTFRDEYLSGENGLYDETINNKKNVYRTIKILYNPPILVFNFKRWINHNKKNTQNIFFDQTIDMGPY